MAKQKKGFGFLKGLFFYLLGVSTGTLGAGVLAAYINELHLPFIDSSPTRKLNAISGKDNEDDEQSDYSDYRDILINGKNGTIKPVSANDTQSPETLYSFEFYLQIGAFRNAETAENLRGKVILNGHATIIKPGNLTDGNTLYRVWVGPYVDKNIAERIRAQLILEGYQDVSLLQLSI